ncbi:MAG: Kazal-type serine protease inhibitor [Bacteroidia bacterium]
MKTIVHTLRGLILVALMLLFHACEQPESVFPVSEVQEHVSEKMPEEAALQIEALKHKLASDESAIASEKEMDVAINQKNTNCNQNFQGSSNQAWHYIHIDKYSCSSSTSGRYLNTWSTTKYGASFSINKSLSGDGGYFRSFSYWWNGSRWVLYASKYFVADCKGIICAAVYAPVCGCDGRTYSNACNASRYSITQYRNGKCN